MDREQGEIALQVLSAWFEGGPEDTRDWKWEGDEWGGQLVCSRWRLRIDYESAWARWRAELHDLRPGQEEHRFITAFGDTFLSGVLAVVRKEVFLRAQALGEATRESYG